MNEFIEKIEQAPNLAEVPIEEFGEMADSVNNLLSESAHIDSTQAAICDALVMVVEYAEAQHHKITDLSPQSI